jgi:DNA repair photolyase
MDGVPISNPPNPWLTSEVEYLDEIPEQRLEVYVDSTKSILATNDSPDLGFKWSVNPYRGCCHACAYCADGDTPVLMGDGRMKPIRDVRVGDVVYGTEPRGPYRRYVRTSVLAHWSTSKMAFRTRLEDGTELITSNDHRFLTLRGWKHVTDTEHRSPQRAHLTPNDKLLGFGAVSVARATSSDYRMGYLTGMVRGDALLKQFRYDRPGRKNGDQYQFRLALADMEALRRARAFLAEIGVQTHEFQFQEAIGSRRPMQAIRTHSRSHFELISSVVEWPAQPSEEWDRGFIAGIFDAEGSCSRGVLRVSNTNERIIAETMRCLKRNDFDAVVEPPGSKAVATNVRLRGGLKERMRFFQWCDPAISRKRDIAGTAIKSKAPLKVMSVEPMGFELPMFDITTGTGDFIANGVVSHNCYARPTHEYLGLGAGTDFDRKITVKPEAARLLRAAFDKKSWKGELVMFSGVTDCYQPLEAAYRLTRGCLEVCAEYRNPLAIITKAPLIERDIDLLVELDRVTDVSITISVPFWDPERARAIEPLVATPQRRIKTIERLAEAGLEVGVNVAPMIPGLGDEDMPKILEAAKDAGATHAGFVFLRLPGSVKQVFEERLREVMPLRADKILHKIRDARGGKLYDSRFGVRGKGEGVYAEQAKALFDTTCRRLGLDSRHGYEEEDYEPQRSTFVRPPRSGDQLKLL